MSWNSMLNECIKLKEDYTKHFGISLDTDFKLMIEEMKKNKLPYNEIFDQVQINQCGSMVLIRYGLHEMGRGMWEDKNSPLREARSLVFDITTEELVLTPFRKFFNLNEVEENSIENIEKEIAECEKFEVSEKMDGSMQSFRYYDGRIIGSGSMALDPRNSFRLEEGYQLLTDNHKELITSMPTLTFIFEYISEKDKHVVPYNYEEQKGLYLIGMRSVIDGEEYPYEAIKEVSEEFDIPCCKVYQYDTLQEVLEHLDKMTVKDGEGFVLNIDGHKVKLKCEDYLQLHRLDDKLSSPNVIIKAFADGTFDDLYANMSPLMKEKNKETIDIIEKYIKEMNNKINLYSGLVDKYEDDLIEKYGVDFLLENSGIFDKKLHKYVNEKVPQDVRECIRMEFLLNKTYNILKSRSGKYKKFNEIEKWVKENCKES